MPKNLKVAYVKKDYDTNKGLELPKTTTYYNIDGEHLFIAPEKASWITVNDMGKSFVEYFNKGLSIKEAVSKLHLRNFEISRG